MSGIRSSTPGQTAIRLLVGTHLLLLVQCWLVLCSRAELGGMVRAIIGGTATLGLLAVAVAVHGGSGDSGGVWTPDGQRPNAGGGQ